MEAEEADDEEEWVEDESSLEDELAVGQAGKGEVGADVQAKIDRILKMFNASSLDDIIALCGNPSKGRFTKAVLKLDPD